MTYRDAIASLVVYEMCAEDTGRYTCEAANQQGTASTSAKLRMQGNLIGLPFINKYIYNIIYVICIQCMYV